MKSQWFGNFSLFSCGHVKAQEVFRFPFFQTCWPVLTSLWTWAILLLGDLFSSQSFSHDHGWWLLNWNPWPRTLLISRSDSMSPLTSSPETLVWTFPQTYVCVPMSMIHQVTLSSYLQPPAHSPHCWCPTVQLFLCKLSASSTASLYLTLTIKSCQL